MKDNMDKCDQELLTEAYSSMIKEAGDMDSHLGIASGGYEREKPLEPSKTVNMGRFNEPETDDSVSLRDWIITRIAPKQYKFENDIERRQGNAGHEALKSYLPYDVMVMVMKKWSEDFQR